MKNSRYNIQKIITSGLAGVTGGILVGAAVSGGLLSIIGGGLIGASITALAEFNNEKVNKELPSTTSSSLTAKQNTKARV